MDIQFSNDDWSEINRSTVYSYAGKNVKRHHFYEKMGYKKIGETEPREDKNGFFLYEYEKKIR